MKIRNVVTAAVVLASGVGCATQKAAVMPTPPPAVKPVVEAPKPPPEPSAAERFQKATQAIQAKSWAEAEDELNKALEKQPDFAQALFDLGYVRTQRGDMAGAVQAYERAHRAAPGELQTVLNLGQLYRRQGELDKGIALHEAALEKNPYDVNLLNNVSVLYRLSKRYDRAEAALHKLLSRTKDNAEAYKNLALLKVEQNDLRLAETLCANAIKLDPKDAGAYDDLGLIQLRTGDLRAALASFAHAAELDPKDVPAHFNLGALALRYRDYANAEKEFGQVVELEPGSAEAHLNHAYALEGQRNKDGSHRLKEAVAEYEFVLKLRPDHPEAIFGEALAYAGELKDLGRARTLLSRYLGLQGELTFKEKATAKLAEVDARLKAGQGAAPQPKAEVHAAPKQQGGGEEMLQKVSDPGSAAEGPANPDAGIATPVPAAAPGAAPPQVTPTSAPAAGETLEGSTQTR